MYYRLLIDLVVLLHFLFILFALLGGFLVFLSKWVALFHIPAVLWAVLVEFRGWICPLTPLENHLRQISGEAGYEGGFIDHYIIPIIYPIGLTQNIQFILGLIVLTINFGIYAWILLRWRG